MGTTPNYDINYEDERFQQVETERDNALTEIDQQYGEMIGNTDKYYQDLINQSQANADKMAEVQNQNKDFAIEKIEQQREKYQKDYTKETSGAYVDWQKQSNQHGVKAEQMAMQGMVGSGFSESSQVAMYTAYQNRIATAREVMAQANLNCDNGIKDAILQNNSALAEIYANANKEQLEIALQGFQYKNELLEKQTEREMQLKQYYADEWQRVLDQINKDNAMAEEVRQYNEEMALKQQQLAEEIRQFNEEIERLKAKDKQEYEMQIKEMELKKQQLEEEKRQFDASLSASRSSGGSSRSSSGGSYTVSGSSGGSGGSSKDTSYVKAPYKVCTPYWRGALNPDVAKYGAFNTDYATTPYQPKGIGNYGKVTSTGKKVPVTSVVKYGNEAGKTKTSMQTVWQTSNGMKWLWNGTLNKYERYYG